MSANQHDPVTIEQVNDFNTFIERGINALQFGQMEEQDYLNLIRLPIYGACLINQLSRFDAAGQIAAAEADMHIASEALTAIGQRWTDTGNFVARADELAALRQALYLTTDILRLANNSHAMRAANETGRIIAAQELKMRRQARKL
ncbi:hypothetical protein [Kerstersia similis]|uniref:hypothetical protein n=1 Tax=Kerstersia similis TaxID=206505 RepID=UPI0039F02345